MDHLTRGVRLHSPPGLRQRTTALLSGAGQRCHDDADTALVVVVGHHVPETLDQLMVEGNPHLVLRLLPEEVVVGPFVLPGVSACARCVAVGQAERTETVEALARAFSGPDPTLAHTYTDADSPWHLLALGAALAARDLHAYTTGALPGTWSATWTLRGCEPPEVTSWRQHAWCGCGWFDDPLEW